MYVCRNARPSYKKGVEGYTDFNTKPAIEFLSHLYKTNTTLVIVGDNSLYELHVCMYECICICVYMESVMYVCMKYVNVRVNITYVCKRTNVCVYITYMKVYVYVDICLDVFMYVCTVCMYVCV